MWSTAIQAVFFFVALIVTPVCSAASSQDVVVEAGRVPVYFFWGEGCPHCEHEKVFLAELQKNIPAVIVHSHEVWFHKENKVLYQDMATAYGASSGSVPATFIGEKVWIGYNAQRGQEIEAKVVACLQGGCIDPAAQVHTIVGHTDVAKTHDTMSPAHAVCVEAFVRNGCPQCENVVAFIQYLSRKFNITLKIHTVVDTGEDAYYKKIKEQYALRSGAFPAVFIDGDILVGDQAVAQFLEGKLAACMHKECRCPSGGERGVMSRFPQPDEVTPEKTSLVSLPFFGEFDATRVSLPVLTVLLGGLDGFNPCAFFVLFLLLSLLVHAQSRARMLVVGGVFVLFSGVMYFVFMAAWLNVFMVVGELAVITKIAGSIAVVIAAINIKEFFFFGKGVSLTIPESAKPVLFERMRTVVRAGSLTGVLVGTIILAIAANTYELLCTAGFPMVFARVLTLHHFSVAQYYGYLALYNVVYVIPLVVIVLVFATTLGTRKLTEWQGRILKLTSGLMMFGLGVVLMLKPGLLNNIVVSVGLISAVLLVAGLLSVFGKKYFNK